jgi:hypothetical protein
MELNKWKVEEIQNQIVANYNTDANWDLPSSRQKTHQRSEHELNEHVNLCQTQVT